MIWIITTPDLDKISRKENKHIGALQCLDVPGLESNQMQTGDSRVSQRGREWSLQDSGLLQPTPEPTTRSGWMGLACPGSGPVTPTHPLPKPQASLCWPCFSLRNQTQYKPLLNGILFSPFNRLEVFYIHRKTTFELVVLFSELCFVFALIKFPLTQISIKCGSHQRQTVATPSLLFSGRRTCLCYGNISLEWADSGKPAAAKTHPFSPVFLQCFKTLQL